MGGTIGRWLILSSWIALRKDSRVNLRHDCLMSQVIFPPGEGGHPALLQQGGQGHGHAVHVEHWQEGEDVHPRRSAAKLWVPSLGEVGDNVPMGETHLAFKLLIFASDIIIDK